ncbi:MAG: GntR family transcriptional regulator [Lachnospiraceae bacterium]|nr:GntR family transcriptional regulator [Lachnospiraceae bacterium]
MKNGEQLKYSRLADELKKKILDGVYRPGEKIPSENELAADYQISRHTVRKALDLLTREGYVYAEHGRGTFCSELAHRGKDSRNIAVVMTYLSDYIFPRVIQGIDQVLTENGYSIILKNTSNSRTVEARCLEELLQKDIEGLIIEPSKSDIFCKHGTLYEKLDQNGIPYVFIQGCFAQMEDKPQVRMDDYMGGYLVTRHLLDLGHQNIMGIFKADDTQGRERHRGYVAALQEAGIFYNPELVVWFHTEDRASKPVSAVREIVARRKLADGVVCYNDLTAMKVIKTLEEEGLRVPDDISVTGYDNSFIAENFRIKLTTIAHPHEKLGETAAALLLDLIRGQSENAVRQVVMEPELIIRESTRAKETEKKLLSGQTDEQTSERRYEAACPMTGWKQKGDLC